MINAKVIGVDILLLVEEPKVNGTVLGVLQREDIVEIIDDEDRKYPNYRKIKIDRIEGYVRSKWLAILWEPYLQ